MPQLKMIMLSDLLLDIKALLLFEFIEHAELMFLTHLIMLVFSFFVFVFVFVLFLVY